MISVLVEKGKLMKEKLSELLCEAIHLEDGICKVIGHKQVEEITEYLISHGVTIGTGELEFDYEAEDDWND